ncbi:M14 family metallopeptidase [Robertkochia flava]|uniref:M14 family metallopeptidase n=1 Tax=Robertkochia flava TaxID=3447986 RepID=UPI001CCD9759|nr:M14 family metallopeptidase [Robertkochia marina]
MKINQIIIFFLFLHLAGAQDVQSPSEFLGYELGSRFSRHHQVISYYEHLEAAAPDRVKLYRYGETYEGRPLMIAYISSPENLSNLDNIRQDHLNNAKGEGSPEKAIVWMSYNVHGNESVSTEASMQTIYELLTSRSALLENTVVIIDPCINPDGRDRYVNWYNQFKNTPYQTDPNSKEHHEPWVSGRPNHYMFDLNRDWAWLTQKESQQRIKLFTQWLPHIHVDFHEQSVNSPYYFAPAAEPLHEVITDWQKEFQHTIGKNHAKYFDKEGWFYFTKERFDLLYPSYGDTYPTYNGAVGMTYEQGGSGRAGLGIITAVGDTLTLKDRIAHHHTTGLSTVEISAANADRLNKEFREFYRADNFQYKSYVLQGDPDKIEALTGLLDAHEIRYGFTDKTVKGYTYEEGKSMDNSTSKLVVSTDQLKGKMVKVLFEPKTRLNDSLTYDITAWSLPYAYGLKAVAAKNIISADASAPQQQFSLEDAENAYAWITDWNSMKDARFLAHLLKNNIKVRFNDEPFTLNNRSFDRGSLIITRGDNPGIDIQNMIVSAGETYNKSIYATSTGMVDKGYDFGSSHVKMIEKPKVAVYSGGSTSTLNFGEIWHFFEQQLNYPVSVLDDSYFNRVDLGAYDILVLPELRSLETNTLEKIKKWVRDGGKLIAIGNTLNTLDGDDDFSLEAIEIADETKEKTSNTPAPFNNREREEIKQLITGAVFKATVDNTHPLGYGYGPTYHTLKLSDMAFKWLHEGTAAYLPETTRPVAGFAGSEALKKQGESLIFGSENMGRGTVIYMVDNPLFRGFWENGKLFFVNALFMAD